MDDSQLSVDDCLRRLRAVAAEIRVIVVARLRNLQSQISMETHYVAGPIARSGDSGEIAESLRAIQRLSVEMEKLSKDVVGLRRHLRLELALLRNLTAASSGTR